MNDPQRHPDDHPRRAEPLQPDKPGSGLHSQPDDDGTVKRDSLRKAREQEGTAVDNTRKGYD
jgi:hypothetical protein